MENLLFKDLQISKELLRAIDDMGFEEATPIQSQSIIPVLSGEDIVAQAPTGTGKTCAFGIPIIENTKSFENTVSTLILCPTRELVIQTTEELLKLSRYKKGIRTVAIYGGQQIERQIYALKKKPQIIVATPGRLQDHLRRSTIKLDSLKFLVLDEADEMLNMGFREDIDKILESAPYARQTALFSATISPEILEITKKYLKPDHKMIKVTPKEVTVPTISQYYIEVKHGKKVDVLTELIDTKDIKLAIIFCNTKKMVDELCDNLTTRGYSAEALHGDMKQTERDRVMSRFKRGQNGILVATDVAARGIDVDNIEVVFNYDIPEDTEYYVHRIGRTGRANREGVSYTFVTSREMYRIAEIMKYTKAPIKYMKAPSIRDMEEKRLSRLLNEIHPTLNTYSTRKYTIALENFLEEEENKSITSLDVAAALLLRLEEALYPKEKPERERPKMPKREMRKKENARLFLNIGTLDKIKTRHIVDLIKSVSPINGKEIEEITILDKYSFVNVPRQYLESLILSLNGMDFKGRTLAVQEANGSKKQIASPRKYSPRKKDVKKA